MPTALGSASLKIRKMAFDLVWDREAAATYKELEQRAKASWAARKKSGKTKATRDEGLFKQVDKCIDLLANNPRHPSLNTHEFKSLANPYRKKDKVFEAYVQHKSPAAYGLFWCYGPGRGQITIIAITEHP